MPVTNDEVVDRVTGRFLYVVKYPTLWDELQITARTPEGETVEAGMVTHSFPGMGFFPIFETPEEAIAYANGIGEVVKVQFSEPPR